MSVTYLNINQLLNSVMHVLPITLPHVEGQGLHTVPTCCNISMDRWIYDAQNQLRYIAKVGRGKGGLWSTVHTSEIHGINTWEQVFHMLR